MKKIKVLGLLVMLSFLFGCDKDDDDSGAGNVVDDGPCDESTVTDNEGNIYNTISIGTQCWMKENLRTGRFNNGDPIPAATTTNLDSAHYDLYDDENTNNFVYGKLYNFYTVADPRGLCPAGWHIPTDIDWEILETHTGDYSVAGGALKDTGSLWKNPNAGATNASNFSAIPGGFRTHLFNGYTSIDSIAAWWSVTPNPNNINFAHGRSVSFKNDDLLQENYRKKSAKSVRCVKDE